MIDHSNNGSYGIVKLDIDHCQSQEDCSITKGKNLSIRTLSFIPSKYVCLCASLRLELFCQCRGCQQVGEHAGTIGTERFRGPPVADADVRPTGQWQPLFGAGLFEQTARQSLSGRAEAALRLAELRILRSAPHNRNRKSDTGLMKYNLHNCTLICFPGKCEPDLSAYRRRRPSLLCISSCQLYRLVQL